jgi:hypothetical protein
MSDLLTIILGGVTLPEQTQLLETTTPIETDVQSLDGSLYTDFINIRRSWSVGLVPLCRDDFDAIYTVYKNQYTNETYTTFVCAARSINTVVKVNISDQDIKWNGDRVDSFTITLKEQFAIS